MAIYTNFLSNARFQAINNYLVGHYIKKDFEIVVDGESTMQQPSIVNPTNSWQWQVAKYFPQANIVTTARSGATTKNSITNLLTYIANKPFGKRVQFFAGGINDGLQGLTWQQSVADVSTYIQILHSNNTQIILSQMESCTNLDASGYTAGWNNWAATNALADYVSYLTNAPSISSSNSFTNTLFFAGEGVHWLDTKVMLRVATCDVIPIRQFLGGSNNGSSLTKRWDKGSNEN